MGGETRPGSSPGAPSFAADVANLSRLLDVLEPRGLVAELDSARRFLDELRAWAPPTPATEWSGEQLDRLLRAVRSHDYYEDGRGVRLEVGGVVIDTRQPGGVPGAGPGDVPEAALAAADSTPAPQYRDPLPGTVPPLREWRCGSCGRAPGFVEFMRRELGPADTTCTCGGEISPVDLEPNPARDGS